MLRPLVAQALNLPQIVLQTFSLEPFGGGAGRGSAVYRVHGTAIDGDSRPHNWSFILKTIRHMHDQADPYGGLREGLAYQSGLLHDTGCDLTAPTCYAIQQPTSDEMWLWLEEVKANGNTRWLLDDYVRVARHLGQFNGIWLTNRGLPQQPWLARNRLADWVRTVVPAMKHFEASMAHPLMQIAYPDDLAQQVMQLWQARGKFLSSIEHLPIALGHGDAFRHNLFITQHGTDTYTTAIDWAQIGTGPPGEDLAPLICVALSFFEIDAATVHEMDDDLFASYIAGLREVAWSGDEQDVRLGYTTAAALRYGLGTFGLILAIVASEYRQQQAAAALNRPITEVMQGYAHMTRYALQCADEARHIRT